jgi:hypothetical protein
VVEGPDVLFEGLVDGSNVVGSFVGGPVVGDFEGKLDGAFVGFFDGLGRDGGRDGSDVDAVGGNGDVVGDGTSARRQFIIGTPNVFVFAL